MIKDYQKSYSINFLCRVLGISRRSYYYWLVSSSKQDKMKKIETEIVDGIERITLKFAGYGYRRVTEQLKREGFRIGGLPVNHKRILRLMREKGLLCRLKRSWINTTDSDHSLKKYPNLVKELGFTPSSLDQLWVADITYIRLPTEFIYLATILDSFSRKVIGFHLGRDLSKKLVLKTLDMTLKSRDIDTKNKGLIHHSDQGVQYCSKEYVARLKELGIDISMTDKNSPWQNGQAESFFKTLKSEEIYLSDYQNFSQAKANITQFIKEVYNKKRLHSAIDYKPPEEYERLLKVKKEVRIKSHKQGELVVQ
jgi:putative transposase